MDPGGEAFACIRTNEVDEVSLPLNFVSALRLGSVIHSECLVFYLATLGKRRGPF